MDDYENPRVRKLRRPVPEQETKCKCDEIMAKDPTRHFRGCPKREEFPTHEADPSHMLEVAWSIIANASNGNWSEQSLAWQEAAKRWRDQWHEILHAKGESIAKVWPGLPEEKV